MPYSLFKKFAAVMILFGCAGCVAALAQTPQFRGIGKPATQEDIGALGNASGPSGKDLPPGKGTAKQGAPIFLVKCAMCHGKEGEGVRSPAASFSPVAGSAVGGGTGTPLWNVDPTINSTQPRVTLAYRAPWVTAIFNTIAVEMPFFRAGTLTTDEVYALTAYVLFKNGLVKEDEVMDRETLPKVKMPNHRHVFIPDEDKTDEIIDIQKRACFKTYGICP